MGIFHRETKSVRNIGGPYQRKIIVQAQEGDRILQGKAQIETKTRFIGHILDT